MPKHPAPSRLIEADAELHSAHEALAASEDRTRDLEARLSSAAEAGEAAAAELRDGWDAAEAAHKEAAAALRAEVCTGWAA
jgi:hypothetical protein